MTPQEAYKIVKEKFNDRCVIGCTEYKDIYVFNLCTIKEILSGEQIMGLLWSVNKNTGEDKVFLPLHIPPEEYKSGKKITDFMM